MGNTGFYTALEKMEALAQQHFPEYTLEIEKYSDGDYKIEAVRSVKKGRLHKFIFLSLHSETELDGFYSRKFGYEQGDILEAIAKPCVGGGLAQTETVEPGWVCAKKIGKLTEVL